MSFSRMSSLQLVRSVLSLIQVYQSRVKTTEILRDAVVNCEAGRRPKAFVQVTGVGYYPPSQKAIYDEASPGQASNTRLSDPR